MGFLIVIIVLLLVAGIYGNQYMAVKKMDEVKKQLDEIQMKLERVERVTRRS
ncbi:hypothetical protein [Paenibacillus pini]|uniref:Uncharacterized protein n=1 Tax=Paenibacillus pini JCM 16418 TaxID=1236976 RepID=W7YF47_9BACL|nr:hypothetical protein [Paenibacillus pini]GAF06113.1 hypothetical protein JCM16418_58 [Paenibacillus pini JCM 16418]